MMPRASRSIVVPFLLATQVLLVGGSWHLSRSHNPWRPQPKQASTKECECIPDYQCDQTTKTVITDGRNIVEHRQLVTCGKANYTCCTIPTSEEEIDDDNPVATKPLKEKTDMESNEETQSDGEFFGFPEAENTKMSMGCGMQYPIQHLEKLFNDPDAAETLEAEFPWMLVVKEVEPSMKNRKGYELPVCGATLIDPRAALTAAHCVAQRSMDKIVVRAGEFDLEDNIETNPVQSRLVSKLIIHPKYLRRPPKFDIAILLFDQPFELNNAVNPVCLPERLMDWENCLATGWGHKLPDQDNADATLKKVNLPLISQEKCQAMLRQNWYRSFRLHNSFLCAGGEDNRDTCLGDGGGPLTCTDKSNSERHYLVGITSWGTGRCGIVGQPGAYTNVTHFYQWIQEMLQEQFFH